MSGIRIDTDQADWSLIIRDANEWNTYTQDGIRPFEGTGFRIDTSGGGLDSLNVGRVTYSYIVIG